jgi:hypothetical protein
MSAVDYLFEQLWELPKDKLTWYAVLKEAKEKYDEEIIDAYCKGSQDLPLDEETY